MAILATRRKWLVTSLCAASRSPCPRQRVSLKPIGGFCIRVFLKTPIYQQIICANNLRSYKFLLQGNSPRCGGDGGFDSANGYVIVRRRIRDYRFPRLVRLSLTGGRDVFLDEHVEDLCSDRADGKLQPRAFLR